MSRILLAPFAEAGHVVPFAVLAAALRAAGHETVVFVDESSARAADCGPVRPPACWRPGTPPSPASMLSGDAGEVFRFMVVGPVVPMARELAAVLADWRADLVVGDVFMPAAGLAAQCAGLPWLSLCCSPLPDRAAYRFFITPEAARHFDAAKTCAELGLPLGADDNLLGRVSEHGHIILGTPRFAGRVPLPDGVTLVGPLATAPEVVREVRPEARGEPEVLVTTTTNTAGALGARAFAQRRYLRTVVEALSELDVRATVTLPAGEVWDAALPDNVRVLGPTPHEPLLDRADAVVCHAGWGTVGRALVRGLPLVLVPLVGDQFPIAERCAELGVGVRLDADTMSPAEAGAAVRGVCRDAAFRAAAAGFAADARTAPGPAGCVSVVESILAGRRRSP